MTTKSPAVETFPGQRKHGFDPTLRTAFEQTPESRRLGMFLALMDHRAETAPHSFNDLRDRAEAYAAHIALFAGSSLVYSQWAGYADREISRAAGF